MAKRLTTEIFIERAKKIHGDKYDYSLVEYINSRSKVKIVCSIHGIFEQIASNHMGGDHCPECIGNKKLTTEIFIKRAKEIYDNKYDYSLVEYKSTNDKVKIICDKHGTFEMRPKSFLKGGGCNKCKGYCKTTKDITKDFRRVHRDKYDYSLVEYVNGITPVKIICPVLNVVD